MICSFHLTVQLRDCVIAMVAHVNVQSKPDRGDAFQIPGSGVGDIYCVENVEEMGDLVMVDRDEVIIVAETYEQFAPRVRRPWFIDCCEQAEESSARS